MILADVSYSMAAARVLSLFSILIPIYMSSAVLSASLANLTSSDNSSSNQPYDTQLISPDAWSSRRNRAAVTNREIVLGRRNRRAADYCPVIVEKEFYVTQLLHLRCLCQPINIRHRLLSWTVVPRDGQGEKPVLFDEEDRLELGTEFDMTIRHAQVTDSGIYYCRDTSRERLLVSYDLTVKPAKSGVRLSLVALSENPLPNRTAAEMTMFSLWSPWGQCNRCGGSGERARIGICHVESENFPEHLGTRKVFACDSENLPSFAREVFGEEIRRPGHTIPFYEIRRPDERRVEFCTEPCPIDQSLAVTDSSGRIVESVLNLGRGNLNRPTLPTITSKKSIFGKTGENITLSCPGEGMDSPVSWKNGSAVLTETELKRTTKGRVFVDIVNSLHIHDLQKQDGTIYTCWIKNRRVGSIKVFVREAIALDGFT
ncbi:Ig-like V-type domain-containing protein FAM187A [Branchiostoma floridae]|uniref:Ig-like V-type domain-containing protein FAM187A n=1 Tax=Branchiostoma floridae TaxID=7739 RepID=A0A9J7MVN7_BRAFL|nr:Ig-like V-type domain-containing protein FAM187A [Branchiostoma floridae]